MTSMGKACANFGALCLVAAATVFLAATAQAGERPNILLIVADDMAYSDLGSYGGEIDTPILDALAKEGLRFSNFYVLPTCSPTRSALMSGNTNHVAGLGVMAEFIYPDIEGRPGYEGYLSDQVAALPEVLRDAGYNTYMSGKWHLGADDDRSPFRRGFERTFTMMQGGGSHWADMRPLTPSEPMIYRRNGQRIDDLPADFYSTWNYTDTLIEFIDADLQDGKPFFGYLSYTAPHDPLHAPAEYISKYDGKYDDGWDDLLNRRLAALQKIGLIPQDVSIPDNFLAPEWEAISEEDKALFSRDMQVYAAMVDYLDMSVGRLFEYLRSVDQYDNTLIVFISDNGANGAPATAYPGNADGAYLATFDNTPENRGLAGSFVDMGPGWARATAAPFRFFKSFTSDGGIRAPMIVRFPGGTKEKGGVTPALAHVSDLMPTFLDIAGADYPDTYRGRNVIPPTGTSLRPVFEGIASDIRETGGIGYELFEMKAFIQGHWKLSRLPKPFGTGGWELYDLSSDPGETLNLANQHPERLSEMRDAWERFARDNGIFDHQGHFDAIYRAIYGVK
ncbi:MAG: arylsulfatase [Paracoccaceae bacterium]